LTEVQQFYAGLIFLFTWLTTVWLLRNLIAGHKVKFRDGLYSSLSPLVSTFLVALVIIAQLIPVAIALLGYSAASSSGILYSGVESMLFWIAAIFLGVMSLYWITSTFIALVVITLPGMYPFVALKTAGDLVVGRRIKMLLRLLWMALILLISWAIVVIPIIMLESWLSSMWSWVSSIPVVPFTMLLMSSFSVTWASSYIYLLYRKIVADDSAPA